MNPLWPFVWTVWGLRITAAWSSTVSTLLFKTTLAPSVEDAHNITDIATSNYTAIPRPEDRGLRVAVVVSVVSGIVILAMSVSFIVCCLQERLSQEREFRRKSRARKRQRQRSMSRRGVCWLEQENGDWEGFPQPRFFHISHRPLSDSPLYLEGFRGYENRGYHRSQENLLKSTVPGLYCSENQLYPHMVLQRVPTLTAPMYLHLPTQPTEAPPPQQVMSEYANLAYYSSPKDTPQRPWS